MKRMLVGLCALSLSGCASMFGGTSQEIEITTTPPGADCAIEREGRVVGRVNPTPGAVMVSKSRRHLTIVCTKPDCQPTTAACTSGVEPWVFGNILFGLLGAPIGLGIDHATGAVNEYDSPVHVSLVPIAVGPAQQAPLVPPQQPAAPEASPGPSEEAPAT